LPRLLRRGTMLWHWVVDDPRHWLIFEVPTMNSMRAENHRSSLLWRLSSWLPHNAVAEVLTLWALAFVALVLASLIHPLIAKVVATFGFIYLPALSMVRRNEVHGDYGLSLRNFATEARLFATVALLVFPLFIVGYVGFSWSLPAFPRALTQLFTPYRESPHFTFRLPPRFFEWTIDQLFVVALPEEFFYRGFIQSRLRDAWPQGKQFLGVRLGPAFWLTALLFALGHLAIFQVWRLAVFFPALLFGWMREKHQGIVGAALLHATANLLMLVLDASFFGR
jgi:uncharacterized protein